MGNPFSKYSGHDGAADHEQGAGDSLLSVDGGGNGASEADISALVANPNPNGGWAGGGADVGDDIAHFAVGMVETYTGCQVAIGLLGEEVAAQNAARDRRLNEMQSELLDQLFDQTDQTLQAQDETQAGVAELRVRHQQLQRSVLRLVTSVSKNVAFLGKTAAAVSTTAQAVSTTAQATDTTATSVQILAELVADLKAEGKARDAEIADLKAKDAARDADVAALSEELAALRAESAEEEVDEEEAEGEE